MKTYTKAVSATLAGALAVGAVPMMAVADDDVVELQSTVEDDINAGAITAYDEAAMADYAEGYVFTAGSAGIGESTALVPAAITGLSGKEYAVEGYRYYTLCAEGEGSQSAYTIDGKQFWYSSYSETAPQLPGKYAVVAWANTNPEGGQAKAWKAEAFTIIPAELTGATAYEVDETGLDLTDTEFVWKDAPYTVADDAVAAEGELNVKIGAKALANDQYNVVAIYDAKGNAVSTIENAGNYELLIEGQDGSIYEGAKDVKVPVTIQQLDLSKAVLTINGIVNGVTTDLTDLYFTAANGIGSLQGQVDVTYSPDESGTLGEHTATVVMKEDADDKANVTGIGLVEYIVVDEICADVAARYDTDADADGFAFGSEVLYVGEEYGVSFDDKYIVEETAYGEALAEDEYVVVVERFVGPDEDDWVASSVAELESGNVQGEYRVAVVVNPAAVDYAFAGASAWQTVIVDNGVIEDATAAFTYKGVLVAHDAIDNVLPVVYSGENYMDDIKANVAAKTNGTVIKYLEEGVDYALAIKKMDEDGEWVAADEIVDWGIYKVEVVSAKYEVDDAALYVGVMALAVSAEPYIQVSCHDYFAEPLQGFCDATVLWTGEEINPVAFFENVQGAKTEVPASAYTVEIVDFKAEGNDTFWYSSEKPGTTLPAVVKDAGIYKIVIADANPLDNYDVSDGEFFYHVTADSVFKDVPSDAWFADEVWLADQLGYMNGYKVGDLFGPYDSIIRGDAALVLFRMAGADQDDTLKVKFDKGTYTPFEDVYQGAYYAKAIAWADDAEIMTGYGDGANFGPNDKITREQVATALYRYDQKLGKEDNLDVLASALDAYVDGDEVSAWAVEAMEWAVAEGVMGVNTDALNPQDEITRAEFAAMMVRYQPQGKLPVEDEEQGA